MSSSAGPLPASAASSASASADSAPANVVVATPAAQARVVETPGLPTIPPELWLDILGLLGYFDLRLRVRLVSKAFERLVADPTLDELCFRGPTDNEQLEEVSELIQELLKPTFAAFQQLLGEHHRATHRVVRRLAEFAPAVDLHPLFAHIKSFGHEGDGSFRVVLGPPLTSPPHEPNADSGEAADDVDRDEEEEGPKIQLSEITASRESATWPGTDKLVVEHMGEPLYIADGTRLCIRNAPGKAVTVAQVLRALSVLYNPGWRRSRREGKGFGVDISDGERWEGWPRPCGYGKDGVVLVVG